MSAIAGRVNFHDLYDRILLKPQKIGVMEKIDSKLVAILECFYKGRAQCAPAL